MNIWLAIVLAAAITIGGGFSFRQLHERRVARHQAKFDDRLSVGEDWYLDELRSLEAYDVRNNSPAKNIAIEISVMIAGFIGLVSLFTGLD